MKNQYICLVLVYIVFSINMQAQEIPRIEPLEEFSQYSSAAYELSSQQFLESAILASGSQTPDEDKIRMENLIKKISSSVVLIDDFYKRGEAILQNLHDSLFKTYLEDQTKIDVLMDTGRYNCVSSAVIYMAAGRSSGLQVQGVRTPDHAFVSVLINEKIIDVETTNEWGYDPGQKKEFTDSFSGSTGYNYVPPGHYSLRSNISDKQMIGLILQNRIAEYQRAGNHRSAVPLAVDRYSLTLSVEAKKDMFDTFSNYSSQLNGSGQYEKGIQFLSEAANLWGTSANVSKALEALVHNFLLSLIEAGKTVEAEQYLKELSSQRIMTDEAVQSDLIMIYDKKTVDLLNSSEEFDFIQNYLNSVLEEGLLPEAKWISYTLFNYIREAEIKADSEGWLEAYLFVKEAPLDIRNQRKYIQLLNSCKGNYVITIHNQFADLFNNSQFSEAEDIILNGLRYIPDNKTLAADLQMIQRIDLQNSH